MNEQPSMFPGALIGPYVQPPEGAVCFTCRCGKYLASVRYRWPETVTWLNYWRNAAYCERCGTRLGQMGNWAYLEDMVKWARAKKRGVKFLGLKEREEKERADGEWAETRGETSYYCPTNPAFLDGGR